MLNSLMAVLSNSPLAAFSLVTIFAIVATLFGRHLKRFREIEKSLKHSVLRERQHIQAILKDAPILLWAVDKKGFFTFYDGKCAELLGIKTSERIGINIFELYGERSEICGNVRKSLQGETLSDVAEVRGLWLENSFTPLYSEKGQIEGVVGLSIDVTEKLKKDNLLRQNEKKFATIFEDSKIPKIVCSWPHIILKDVNRAWCETFEYQKDEVIGKSSLELKLFPELEKNTDSHNKIIETDTLEDFETIGRTKSGKELILSISGSVFELSGEQYVVFSEQDITESRRLEKQMAATFNAAAIGILHTGVDGKWLKINQKFCQIIGYTEQELQHIDFSSITHPDDYPRNLQEFTDFIKNSENNYSIEKRYFKKDRSVIWVKLTGSAVLGSNGQTEYYITFIEDITLNKKIEEEKVALSISERAAQQASQMKSEFLANMSHEIRTPINGVMGITNILLDTSLNPEQRDYALTVLRSTETLLTVVNDILDFSKVEAGKMDLELVDFDLQHMIQDLHKTLIFSAQKKQLPLLLTGDMNWPIHFKGDPGRIRQILTNLLGNAIKFTQSGHVKLHVVTTPVEPGRSTFRFEIQDSGIGISALAQGRLFKSFSQADSSVSRRFGGAGLGLSISRKLVELMDGQIGVTSEEGKGSTFWFEITLENGPSLITLSVDQAKSDDPLIQLPRPMRILLAEDNSVNQLVALKQLEKIGLRADAVANGNEVLNALNNFPYDLILMDCQMPELDGYEATRLIRANRSASYSQIPIVALTANAINGDKEKCLEAGMDDYLAKPVQIAQLRKILEKWLTHAAEPKMLKNAL